MPKRTLLIVWHSRTGAAQALAEAVAAGAAEAIASERSSSSSEAVAVRLLAADRADAADLLDAAGFVFAAPENLGTLSGAMKEFLDRCYYPLLGRIEGRSYASVIAAGSAGQGAQAQLDRIVTGWRLRRIAPPMIVNLDAQTPERIAARKTVPPGDLAQCHELGQAFATGLDLGLF
ncbi:NAD(P)H-dependent oxidoreductase [Novosphingobium sp.]|uniref:NAD(P)H-dependent oxidoreductase n=1 Tax=Novosphingobium sp. TaxID=1874826 RepID=UPI0038BAADF7